MTKQHPCDLRHEDVLTNMEHNFIEALDEAGKDKEVLIDHIQAIEADRKAVLYNLEQAKQNNQVLINKLRLVNKLTNWLPSFVRKFLKRYI